MLDRLERTDRPAELDAFLGVADGQVESALRHSHLQGGGEYGASRPPLCDVGRRTDALADRGALLRERDTGDGRQRVHGIQRLRGEGTGGRQAQRVVGDQHDVGRVAQMLGDEHGLPESSAVTTATPGDGGAPAVDGNVDCGV
jgi:hypothetical protein